MLLIIALIPFSFRPGHWQITFPQYLITNQVYFCQCLIFNAVMNSLLFFSPGGVDGLLPDSPPDSSSYATQFSPSSAASSAHHAVGAGSAHGGIFDEEAAGLGHHQQGRKRGGSSWRQLFPLFIALFCFHAKCSVISTRSYMIGGSWQNFSPFSFSFFLVSISVLRVFGLPSLE